MAKKSAINKLHEIIGGEKDFSGDGSGSWLEIKNDTHEIVFEFNEKGTVLKNIQIRQRVFVEDCSKLISKIG